MSTATITRPDGFDFEREFAGMVTEYNPRDLPAPDSDAPRVQHRPARGAVKRAEIHDSLMAGR